MRRGGTINIPADSIPDNNKRLKAAMEEHGILDDTQSSGLGSEDEDEDDGEE
jgi:hypothetical protein